MELLTLGQAYLDARNTHLDCNECYNGDCLNCCYTINLLDIVDKLESKAGCNVH